MAPGQHEPAHTGNIMYNALPWKPRFSWGVVFFNAAVSCLTRLYTEVTQNYTLLGKRCRYLAEVIKL